MCLIKRLYIIGSIILTMIFCNELKLAGSISFFNLYGKKFLQYNLMSMYFVKMYIMAQDVVIFAKKHYDAKFIRVKYVLGIPSIH